MTDTGIGVRFDKQKIIFEAAFQQADSTTSHGTRHGRRIIHQPANWRAFLAARFGCGVSRVWATPSRCVVTTDVLLRGYDIEDRTYQRLRSKLLEEPHPLKYSFHATFTKSAAAALAEEISIEDDRNNIHQNDPVLLIVEDDPAFARILIDMAHEQGLKALVALRGNTALALATEFQPSAITLDIGLPDMMGWTIVDRLKHDSRTRQIRFISLPATTTGGEASL